MNAERFWARVQQCGPAECWPWMAARSGNGYGYLKIGGRMVRAHRVAYELEHGPIPAGAYILHSCDVPTCCNPDHLRVGDHAENMADMVVRRRGVRYGDEVVREVRRLRAGGGSHRQIARVVGMSPRWVGYIVAGEARVVAGGS